MLDFVCKLQLLLLLNQVKLIILLKIVHLRSDKAEISLRYGLAHDVNLEILNGLDYVCNTN